MTNKKNKVLIVEDEGSLRDAMKDKLNHDGFEVIVAKNGEEGLERALNDHPDMIILDIVMPKMDGLTMLKNLREDGWGKTSKVIMLTNLSDNAKVAEAMQNDTFDYFVKSDIKMEEIVEKIKEKLVHK